ncbi:MAG: T9SS type A sorting domain-containing protein [Bacteroidales bacterium]|jgi:hypothetical protein|nr:T9SS type A sorting domain-containing protein [Bacteroidales bacterium]
MKKIIIFCIIHIISYFSIFSQDIDIYTATLFPMFGAVNKNGEMLYNFDIPGANNSAPYGIFVHNGDVYVAAELNHMYGGTIVWKNGVLDTLVVGGLGSDVFVSSTGNEYVAGCWLANGTIHNIDGKVWKNREELYTLSEETKLSGPISIFIDEHNGVEDVYVSGVVSSTGLGADARAVVWKNGEVLYLIDGPYGSGAITVFVHNGDVYFGGDENVRYLSVNGRIREDPVGKVWKNGVEIYSVSTPNYPAVIMSVYVSGNDVYAGGRQIAIGSCSDGKIWKNGEELYSFGPPDGYSDCMNSVNSIRVVGNDVYAAGRYGYDGRVWKNGEMLYHFHNSPVNDMFIDTHGVGITEHEAEAGVKVYPNPAREQVTVELPLTKNGEGAKARMHESTKAVFVLYDVQGRELLRQEIGDKESINVSRFVAGIYIYTVEFGGRKSTGKLIIN